MGEAGVLYCVFPRNPVVCPTFLGAIGSPFRTEILSGIPFGIPGRAGPVLVALRQQAGRVILYHIIFLIMSILYHGKKLRTFLPMPCICAIRLQPSGKRCVIKKFITH